MKCRSQSSIKWCIQGASLELLISLLTGVVVSRLLCVSAYIPNTLQKVTHFLLSLSFTICWKASKNENFFSLVAQLGKSIAQNVKVGFGSRARSGFCTSLCDYDAFLCLHFYFSLSLFSRSLSPVFSPINLKSLDVSEYGDAADQWSEGAAWEHLENPFPLARPTYLLESWDSV